MTTAPRRSSSELMTKDPEELQIGDLKKARILSFEIMNIFSVHK